MEAILVSAIAQGLLWSILGMGIHVSYRILDISDLTAEGSFTLGAASFASLVVSGVPAALALVVAIAFGALSGLVTGLLHTKLSIPILLSSILSMTGLYSINLRIMGKANIPLSGETTLLTYIADALSLARDRDAAIILGIVAIVIIILFMVWLFNTEFGYTIVATGSNDKMIRANGVNSDVTKIAGLMIANALIALAGALVAQYNGYADVGMGIGAIVIGLASVIIGEVIFKRKTLLLSLLGIVCGSIIYRLLVALVINTDFISANDIRLFTAIAVAIAIFIANKDIFKRKVHKDA